MSPYMNQQYISTYEAELRSDLRRAMTQTATSRKVRKTLGRSLVRVGAWMMPDKPELVADTVLVLPKQARKQTIRKAA